MRTDRARFDRLVREAIDRVPKRFLDELENAVIEVRDRPGSEAEDNGRDLLGLHTGPTRMETRGPLEGPHLPSRILLYKRNLEAACADEAELRREIEHTLRHEIAHHLGFEEEDMEREWPEIR